MLSMLPQLPWTRYWHPRGENLTYTHEGFLPDPEDHWEKRLNSNLRTLENLDEHRCLILLGEAGMGKSNVLENEYLRLQGKLAGTNTAVIHYNLGNIGGDASLFRNLFDLPDIIEWKHNNDELFLLLDSFDEALLDLSTLGGLLEEELKKWPLKRLKLRICCRPAVWQSVLEAYLIRAFDKNDVRAYSLAPLKRADVVLAAKSLDLAEPDSFVQEIVSKSVTPFAIKPVTLKMLLSSFQQEGSLPSTQNEIYRQGCFWLSKEVNRSRVERGKTGQIPPEERLLVAQYIAAASIYCKKPSIRVKAQDPLEPSDEVVELDSLRLHHKIEINDPKLRETLDTALFATSGNGLVTWAHRTYGEFLAAEWCSVNDVPAGRVFEFLSVNDEGKRRIPSQLIQAAAWLAEIVPDVRTLILKNDPRVLLYCDGSVLDHQIRRDLAHSLLEQYESRDEVESYYRQFHNVCHPGLTEQLRPYIRDRKKILAVRQVAAHIATVCSVGNLGDDLVAVALDVSETRQVRIAALVALSEAGSDNAKASLRHLALFEEADDVDDEIKGWALRCVWPNHITPEELFKALTLSKKRHFSGGYHSFLFSLAENLDSQLPLSGILVALQWAASLRFRDIETDPLGYASDAIVRMAWEQLNVGGVSKSLATLISTRMDEFGKILSHETILGERAKPTFDELLISDDGKRHALVLDLIPLVTETGKGRYLAFHYHIILDKDALWLTELQKNYSAAEKSLILDWLRDLPNGPRKQDAILRGLQEGSLDESFRNFIYIELDSPLAKHLKGEAAVIAGWSKTPEPLQPSAAERVRVCLETSETGDVFAWVKLADELTLSSDSIDYPLDDFTTIQGMPGWNSADDLTRKRIISAALQYVHRAQTPSFEFIGTNSCPLWAMAEFKALLLLVAVTPDQLVTADDETLKRWSAVALWYPFQKERDLYEKFLQYLFKLNREAALEGLALALLENTKGRDCYEISNGLRFYWSSEAEQLVLSHLGSFGIDSSCSRTLLRSMLELKSEKAQRYTQDELRRFFQRGDEQLGLAADLASMLLKYAAGESWQLVWSYFQESTTFGKGVIERSAQFGEEPRFSAELSDRELADLYIWLEKNYPHTTDRELIGGFVGPRESVAHFRDQMLVKLYKRGAVQEVDRIMKEFPEHDWLHWQKRQARDARAQRLWLPPTPEELLGLAEPKLPTSQPAPSLNDFLIALICNVLANVLFWFVPSYLSRGVRVWFGGTAVIVTLYVLYFRKLRVGNAFVFWAVTILVLLLGSASLAYSVENWWAQ